MEASMNKVMARMLGKAILYCSVAVAVPMHVTAEEVKGLNLTSIRAYTDGNMHLYFNSEISAACGKVVRAPGPNSDSLRTLALAGLMSGRAVAVDVEPQKSGNFCNVLYIRLDK
jgi:hypothetical protein